LVVMVGKRCHFLNIIDDNDLFLPNVCSVFVNRSGIV